MPAQTCFTDCGHKLAATEKPVLIMDPRPRSKLSPLSSISPATSLQVFVIQLEL